MRVQAGADCGAPERNPPDTVEGRLDAGDSLPDLGRVAPELLAERHGDGVHQVRPAGLDGVLELGGLRLELLGQAVERGQEVVDQLVERGEMDGRGEDVVRGLAHVHVVVRVHTVAGEGGDDLVCVHVRRRARSGLEDVDPELLVQLPGGNAIRRRCDSLSLVLVEEAQLGVHPRGSGLDAPEPPSHMTRDRLA